jgi:hypothetical protein
MWGMRLVCILNLSWDGYSSLVILLDQLESSANFLIMCSSLGIQSLFVYGSQVSLILSSSLNIFIAFSIAKKIIKNITLNLS